MKVTVLYRWWSVTDTWSQQNTEMDPTIGSNVQYFSVIIHTSVCAQLSKLSRYQDSRSSLFPRKALMIFLALDRLTDCWVRFVRSMHCFCTIHRLLSWAAALPLKKMMTQANSQEVHSVHFQSQAPVGLQVRVESYYNLQPHGRPAASFRWCTPIDALHILNYSLAAK